MRKRLSHVIMLVLIGVLVITGALLQGCQKPEPKQPEAPKQEAPPPAPPAPPAQAPSTQAPAEPAGKAEPQSSQTPPAQLGKGSTAPTAQTAIPTEAKLNMQQGMNYLRSRDYDNAIKEFTVAIEKYPSYDVAYSNRAVAYMQQKKFNKALDDLKKAEEINPKNPTVHYNFVALYSLQNQLDRSLDSLDRTLELGFNNYDALRTDPDLANVRKHPEFKKTLEKHKVFIMK
jgi:tetratricopeptide (TPR) repeat protein